MKKILISIVFVAVAGICNAQTNNAYGDNQVEVEPGVFAIYSGDINQDGYVDIVDYPLFEADQLALASGYLPADLNGDGYVDIVDYPLFELNQLNLVSVIIP